MTTFSARLETLFPRRVPGRVPGRRPGSRRPSLERLEDRTLLSHGVSFAPPVDLRPGCTPPAYAAFQQASGDQLVIGKAGVRKATDAVAAADLNHDGLPDLVSTNFLTNTVSVFLANGRGGYAAPQSPAVGGGPGAVAVADFTGDGNPDVAVADVLSGDVALLAGNKDGTFAPARLFPIGLTPAALAVGRFDGGSLPELAVAVQQGVANGQANVVSILKWDDAEGFTAAGSFSAPGAITALAAGAFRGDPAHDDLAVAGKGGADQGPVWVYLNHTSGQGTPAFGNGTASGGSTPDHVLTARGDPKSIAATDFNGDGVLDLAVLGFTSTVTILNGQGGAECGNFVAAQTPADDWDTSTLAAGEVVSALAAGDLNGDGCPDLVVSNFGSGTVTTLVNNGDGTFQSGQDFWVGNHPTGVAVVPSADGRGDVAVGRTADDQVTLLANQPGGSNAGDGVRIDAEDDGEGNDAGGASSAGQGVRVYRNLHYGIDSNFTPLTPDTDPHYAQHVLDIYTPKDTKNYPVIFFMHGGDSTYNTRNGFNYLWESLAQQGIGVVSISINGSDTVTNDQNTAEAVAWTYRNIANYGGDPGRIFGLGQSGGIGPIGDVASDPEWLKPYGLAPAAASGLPGVFRGVIFADGADTTPTPTAPGGPTSGATPIPFPPFLALTGTEGWDLYGLPMPSAAEFYAQYVAEGAQVQWDIIQGRDHFTLMADAALPGDPTRKAVLDFINASTHTTGISVLNGPAGTTAGLTTSGTPSVGGPAPRSPVPQPGVPANVGLGLSASAAQPLAAAASASLTAGIGLSVVQAVAPVQAAGGAAATASAAPAPAGMSASDQVFVEWSARMRADALGRAAAAVALGRRSGHAGEAPALDPLFDWLGGL